MNLRMVDPFPKWKNNKSVTRDIQEIWNFTDCCIYHSQPETGKDHQTYLRGALKTEKEALNNTLLPADNPNINPTTAVSLNIRAHFCL